MLNADTHATAPFPTLSPDYLRPIRENSNREEAILVEFHRVLRNTNQSLLYNLFVRASADPALLEVLPQLPVFAKYDIDTLYAASVLYNHPVELIRELSEGRLSPDTCEAYAAQFSRPYGFERLHVTAIEGALRNLLDQKFVHRLYVTADAFTDEMKGQILKMFGSEHREKLHALEGPVTDALLTYSDITTVIMSDVDELYEIYQFNPDAMKNRLFIVMDGYSNYDAQQVGKDTVLTYKYMDTWEKLHREKICSVGFAYPHCVPLKPIENLMPREDDQNANPE